MMKTIFKTAAFVVFRTNVFPMSWAYRFGYRACAYLCARTFHVIFSDDIEASFLRRSLGSNDAIPGLSDIDLLFVLKESVSTERRERLWRHYDTLCKLCPLLDRHREFFKASELSKLYHSEPVYSFRIAEGRETWRRLSGPHEFRESFAPPTEMQLVTGVWVELKIYLTYLNQARGKTFLHPFDIIKHDYMLYKFALALAAARDFSVIGSYEFSRRGLFEKGVTNDLPEILRDFTTVFFRSQGKRSPAAPTATIEANLLFFALDIFELFYRRFAMILAKAPFTRFDEYYQANDIGRLTRVDSLAFNFETTDILRSHEVVTIVSPLD